MCQVLVIFALNDASLYQRARKGTIMETEQHHRGFRASQMN